MILSQERLIREILEVGGMTDCSPSPSPFEMSLILSKEMSPITPEGIREMVHLPYRQVVGKLLYLSTNSRLDITTAVSIVSRYVQNPGIKHWRSLQKILRYVKSTIDTGLKLKVMGGKCHLYPIQGCSYELL